MRKIAKIVEEHSSAEDADWVAERRPFRLSGMVRLPEVLRFLAISRSAFYAGIAAGRYPKPRKLGRASVWGAEEIRALVQVPANTVTEAAVDPGN